MRDIVFLYYIAPFVVVIALFLLYAWRQGRTDKAAQGAYAALHSPSVTQARTALARRVAMAVREAKMGFVECAGCGFANAQRAASCVLCGVQLDASSGPTRKRFWPLGTQHTASGHRHGGAVSGAVTARQRRIRRRRDWIRDVDAQGHAEWKYSGQDPQASSFVLQTELHADALSTVASDAHHEIRSSTISAHSEPSVEVVVEGADVKTVTPTAADVARMLQDEVDRTDAQIVDARYADGARVAYASRASAAASDEKSSMSISDSIRNAHLDFPTKLAHFITSMASRFARESGDAAVTRLTITRDNILADSVDAIATMTAAAATGAIRVEFLGEQGIDAGGVYREWFLMLNEQIVTPRAGVFVCVDEKDQAFYLNPLSRDVLGDNHLAHLFAAGRLLGRALLEGNVTGFHLALPLLKIILGVPVGLGDLEYFDGDVHKNLQWLLENDGVGMLGLDFTVTQRLPNGSTREVELVPGGEGVDVTDANKHEYVDRKVRYLLFDSVHNQLSAFLKGLYEIVPAELLALFDAEELDYVLSGSDAIDVDDWERNTITSANLAYYPADELFWEVVRELSPDERRRLLQFATGSTRVPPGGFAALTSNDGQLCLFMLRGVTARETRGYLYAHACFNRVNLPMHKNVKEMRLAVLAAIDGDTTGFTTD